MPNSKQNKWKWFIIYIYFQFMLRQLTNRTTEQILLDKRGHHSIIFSDIQLRAAWNSVPLVLFTENSMIFAKDLDIDVLNPVSKENENSQQLKKPFLDEKSEFEHINYCVTMRNTSILFNTIPLWMSMHCENRLSKSWWKVDNLKYIGMKCIQDRNNSII